MSRTSEAAVKGVLAPGNNYDLRNNPSVLPYIETASANVDDLVAAAAEESITITSTRAELIERWLAAHYYTKLDATYLSRSTQGASGSFARTADDLKNAAIALDPSGLLAGILENKTKPKIIWLGKTKTQQLDYEDRN